MAIGGPTIAFSFIHLSNLFPDKKASIISWFYTLITASSLIFLCFQVCFEFPFFFYKKISN
jgi:hypothetical protein